MAPVVAVLAALWLTVPVHAGVVECEPLFTFDQGGGGWYYLEADGSKNYDLWRPGAGVDGTGALVLPPGVDAIFLDAPLDLPAVDVCFDGKPSPGSPEPTATVWWLEHGHSVACLEEGCYLTHFPPRPATSGLPAGFERYHFPRAMIQGPQCDQPEISTIAVVRGGSFAIDNLGVLADAAGQDGPPGPLYTVTDENELAAVDVDDGCSATLLGVTRDADGSIRRIRGLAYDQAIGVMYGMTREGDLVTVDRLSAETTPIPLMPSLVGEFWGALAFDDTTGLLYTVDAFAEHHLVEIDPVVRTSRIVGSTQFDSSLRQILGLALYPPPPAPAVPPTFNGKHPEREILYGSNRNNDNIVVVDKTSGVLSFDLGTHTIGVNNLQAITFHPTTGILYAIHDRFSSSNNAALSTYDFTAERATELCELPFGIVESVGGGNDTYGWGGLTFAPAASPTGCDPDAGGAGVVGIFCDGFESGDTSAWSSTVP